MSQTAETRKITDSPANAQPTASRSPRSYPDFEVVQRVRSDRNFVLERVYGVYCISWWCSPHNDFRHFKNICPTLYASMKSANCESDFALLDAKLHAFDCNPLDYYIFRNSGRLDELSRELGGSGFESRDSWATDTIGFTYQFDNEDDASDEYNRIMQSAAAEELEPRRFRFNFRNLPGGRNRAYTLFEGITNENDIGNPVTARRLREIFTEVYTSYPHGAKQPELKLIVEPTTLQSYIVTDEDCGISLRLDPKRFIPKRYRR